MKRLVGGLMALTLFAAGCGKESEPGGPGAKTTQAPNGAAANGKGTAANGETKTYADAENTFTLKVPAIDVNVKQGEDETVTLTINRGEAFKQKVSVMLEAPPGITVEPKSHEVAPGENELKVRIAATGNAPLDKSEVTVTATPETGKAVSQTFSVDVSKAEGDAPPPATNE